MLALYRSTDFPRLKNLVLTMFAAWLAFFFVVHAFIRPLNKIVVPVLHLPLGSYLPMQAAVIVFAVTVFWFARAARYARA